MRGSISVCVSGQDGTGWRVMVASPSVAPQADACRAARHATRRAGPRGPDPSSVGHEPERAKGKESEAGEAAGELPEVATHGILPIHSWIERSASCRPPARLRHAIPLGRSEDVPAAWKASRRAFAAASPMSISAVCNTADDPHCASTRKSSGNCVFIASRQWFPACLESGDEYPHCRGSTILHSSAAEGRKQGPLRTASVILSHIAKGRGSQAPGFRRRDYHTTNKLVNLARSESGSLAGPTRSHWHWTRSSPGGPAH